MEEYKDKVDDQIYRKFDRSCNLNNRTPLAYMTFNRKDKEIIIMTNNIGLRNLRIFGSSYYLAYALIAACGSYGEAIRAIDDWFERNPRGLDHVNEEIETYMEETDPENVMRQALAALAREQNRIYNSKPKIDG